MFPASAKAEDDRIVYPKKNPFDLEHLIQFIETHAVKKVNLSSVKKDDL